MKKIKTDFKLYEINYLYPLLHFGIKNISTVILRSHEYFQELTPQIFNDVARHVELIPPSVVN